MRKLLATLCIVGIAALASSAQAKSPKAAAGNNGVQPGTFDVDIYIVLAHRSAVEGDDGTRAIHYTGKARATTDGATIHWDDNDGDDDNFITLTADKGANSDTPTGYIKLNDGTFNNNRYEGTGVGVFNTDGSGDPSGSQNDNDANGDGVNDNDQAVPIRYFVVQRSNAKGDFLMGTLHNLVQETADENGQGGNTQSTTPRFNGRLRGVPAVQ